MIPKKIHYFWFGGKTKSDLVLQCINSWKKHCPDYEIIEWNEDNYDVHKNLYMEQAFQSGRWGFVSDYARLDIIYEYGGIYLDTDVEVIKPLDDLLNHGGYIGFERNADPNNDKSFVNTGQGFGARKNHPVIKKMLEKYDNLSFSEDGKENLTTCPYYNTDALMELGLNQEDKYQEINDFIVYPSDYFCPINWKTKSFVKSPNTYSIHYFNASWLSDKEKKRRKRERVINQIVHLPNRVAITVLGQGKYDRVKKFLKRK